jgi:hypothetical protein
MDLLLQVTGQKDENQGSCPNHRAAVATGFAGAVCNDTGLRRLPRCHGITVVSALLAAIIDFNQRRSFFMALILSTGHRAFRTQGQSE